MTDAAAFVRANTAIATPPLVPEIRLHLATEITPIWQATEETLARAGLPPPFWAFAWAGGQALARYLLDRPETVAGQVASWLRRRAARSLVLLADPGRAYVPADGLVELARYDVPTSRELEDRETRETTVWRVMPAAAPSAT